MEMADNSGAKPSGEPGWKWRRAVIFPLVMFGSWRLVALESAQSSELNETIAWGWLILIASLVFFYTGFATIQDVMAIWVTKSGKPYKPDEPAEPQQ